MSRIKGSLDLFTICRLMWEIFSTSWPDYKLFIPYFDKFISSSFQQSSRISKASQKLPFSASNSEYRIIFLHIFKIRTSLLAIFPMIIKQINIGKSDQYSPQKTYELSNSLLSLCYFYSCSIKLNTKIIFSPSSKAFSFRQNILINNFIIPHYFQTFISYKYLSIFLHSMIEGQVEAKLNSINTSNPIEGVKQFLKARPINSRNKNLILKDIEGFQFLMGKIHEKQYDNLIRNLNESECQELLDYLHRFMQYIGESESNIMSGSLLKLHEKIIGVHGPSLLIVAVSRNDTLVHRILNF